MQHTAALAPPLATIGQARSAPLALSRDGKLAIALLLILLLSPYFPQFGPLTTRLRPDNFLLPLLALGFLGRAMLGHRVVVTPPQAIYLVFLGWLVAVAVVIWRDPPVGWLAPTATTLIAGLDAYVRPLLILFLASQARVSGRDVVSVARFLLLVSIPLFLLGVLQLLPVTRPVVNSFVLALYDSGRGSGDASFTQLILLGGRVMSVFGQVGTLGMFSLLCIALLTAHAFGARIIKSQGLRWLIGGLAVVGGVISGSKVFTGGIVLLFLLLLLASSRARRVMLRPKVLISVVLSLGAAGVVLYRVFSAALEGLFIRLDPALLYEVYFQTRLGSSADPTEAKLLRTGAFDVVADFPLTGMGLLAVGDTTDSFLLGILIMGGAVGAALYLLFIGSVITRLHSNWKRMPDPNIAGMSRAFIFLTLVLFAAAIGFHTFIQDRAGDAYWLLVGLLISPRLGRGDEARPAPTRPSYAVGSAGAAGARVG